MALTTPSDRSDSPAVPGLDDGAAGPNKRRKVRKGTHTCWECKRRKVRCTFAASSDTSCVGCTKRCLRCVSQEYPEETTTPEAHSRLVGERIIRVEQILKQLTEEGGGVGLGGTRRKTPNSGAGLGAAPISNLSPTYGSTVSSEPASTILTPSDGSRSSSGSTPMQLASGDALGTSLSSRSAYYSPSTTSPSTTTSTHSSGEQISAALLAAYPSDEDLNKIICGTRQAYVKYQSVFWAEPDALSTDAWPPAELRERYTAQTNPVLIARQMLVLVVLMQISDLLPPEQEQDQDRTLTATPEILLLQTLSEPADVIVRRLGDTAGMLVARNDELVDSLEGIQCIMMDGMYKTSLGELRRCWLTWRRALSMAQLMCLPRMRGGGGGGGSSGSGGVGSQMGRSLDPQFMWYRMVTFERFQCLLLGLPSATPADTPILPPEELGLHTPEGRLEYRLGHITNYILDRNARGTRRPESSMSTRRIDIEMQDMAASLPARWWLPPNLAAVRWGSIESATEMSRLLHQVHYYHLLNQLHLPYIIRSGGAPVEAEADSVTGTGSGAGAGAGMNDFVEKVPGPDPCDYSRLACVSSSREVLCRYIMLRSHNRSACCCRYAEFFALMAALTLILVHLDGHRRPYLMVHQRLSDRAMAEEALACMEWVSRANHKDAISETSVDLLRQLLDLEAERAANDCKNCNNCSSYGDNSNKTDNDNTSSQPPLRISVPYFGRIVIASDGAICMEVDEDATPLSNGDAPDGEPRQNVHSSIGIATEKSSMSGPVSSSSSSSSSLAAAAAAAAAAAVAVTVTEPATLATTTEMTAGAPFDYLSGAAYYPDAQPQPLNRQGPGPNHFVPTPAAGTDQWAFQGVDMAFFDSLMRDTSDWGRR